MIQNVLFDLDGTLLDTREGIIHSVKYVIEKLGLAQITEEEKLSFIGPPIQNSLIRVFGIDQSMAQKGAEVFRNYYSNECLFEANPYEGIYELCKILKKNEIKMAVATYKREDYAVRLLNHFQFGEYCNPMHGADNNNILKKEDIINLCIQEMGARKDETVLIGDTEHDAIGAKNASIPFIAVTYGFGFHEKQEIDKYPHIGIANTPLEIADIIFQEGIS